MKKLILTLIIFLSAINIVGCKKVNTENVPSKQYIYGMTDLSYQESGVDYHYTHKLFKNMGVQSVRLWMHCNWIMKDPNTYSESGLEQMRDIYNDIKDEGYLIIAMNHSNFHQDYYGEKNSSKTTAKPHRDLSEGSLYLKWLNDLETTYYNMVLAFPEIEYWEIDNECNNDDFMPAIGGVAFDLEEKAAIYYDMMYFASRGIHKANPNAKTIMGGLVTWNAETFLEFIYDYIEDEETSWSTNPDDYFQIACWHPYMTDFSKDKFIVLNNNIYYVIKKREGKDKKVFLTEVGFSEGNGNKIEDQVNYIKDMYDACKNDLSYVESVHYFRMYDEYSSTWGSDAEKTFGLFYDPVNTKTSENGVQISLAQPKSTALMYQQMAGGSGSLDIYKDFLNGNYTTKLIMHRGYNTKARENTVTSFTFAAQEDDVYAIETDVRLTKDNKPILIHDEDVGRVSLYRYNYKISDTNYETLRNIRLPDINGNHDVEQIPNLEEYLNVLKTYNKVGFIELKEDFSEEQLDIILNEINASNFDLSNLVFISFYKDTLNRLRNKNSNLELMLLVNNADNLSASDLLELEQKNFGLGADVNYISDDTITSLQAKKIKLNLWTINNKTSAHKYGRMSVDYITSDSISSFKD